MTSRTPPAQQQQKEQHSDLTCPECESYRICKVHKPAVGCEVRAKENPIRSRPHPAPAQSLKGELEYGTINKKGEDWRLRKFDAGMGENEYRIFKDGVFFAQFDNRKDADTIMELMTIPDVKARKAREDVLGLARDMYGLMMCVEKTNTDEFMEYYAERMKGLKEQYESLQQQAGDPR